MARDTKRGLANCIERLGDIAHMARVDGTEKSLENANALYEKAFNIYEDIGDLIGRANCNKGSGDVRMAWNEHEQALDYYDKAKRDYEQSCYEIGVANCEYSAGDINIKNQDYHKAVKSYGRALSIYQRIFSYHGRGNCWYSLADCKLADRQEATLDEAFVNQINDLYYRALDFYNKLGITSGMVGRANCYQGLGDILAIRGKKVEAENRHNEAAEWLSRAFQDDRGPTISFEAFGQKCLRWRR